MCFFLFLLIFISLHMVISLHMSVCLSLHLSSQISLSLYMCAFWTFTRERFERTHGSVSARLSVCLFVSSRFFCPSLFSGHLSFFLFSVSCRLSLLLFSMTMTLFPRSIGCLCTQGSDLLCDRSACTLTHFCVVWFVCAVCYCVMPCDVACCHYCRRCVVGCVSVDIDA